jgi:hypothetical protein
MFLKIGAKTPDQTWIRAVQIFADLPTQRGKLAIARLVIVTREVERGHHHDHPPVDAYVSVDVGEREIGAVGQRQFSAVDHDRFRLLRLLRLRLGLFRLLRRFV